MPYLIAIDGPAGAGKSTVARRIAAALGFTYLDTGAMYRSVAWKALQSGVAADSVEALTEIARGLAIRFSPIEDDDAQRVWLDGEDVTLAIRTPEVSGLTSRISAIPSVRSVVVDQQRCIAQSAASGVVLEGRDIGTVVFPDANLKVFLTANPKERARRRMAEMRERGIRADIESILAEIIERDNRDSHRSASPLTKADDAIAVETDGLSVNEVVRHILALWRDRES